MEALLRRFGPLAAAVVSIAVVWFVWGRDAIPKVQDESSYLLQAEIFARGRWTAPAPAIPEFFEQPHVQVVPRVASKYPPGHALLLAAGVLAGFPPLVPLVLTGVTAALLVALTMRVANPWVALLAWALWSTAPIVLRYQPGYFSEVTTAALVLVGWWALHTWRQERRRRWLILLALAVGWGAITRPLTMLAFALPIGFIVLRDAHRRRLWGHVALALVTGAAVLSLLPLWSARTTGDWRLSPVEKYRRDYLPFDRIGFTPDTSPPRRAIAPPLQHVSDYFRRARAQQTLSALPATAGERLWNVGLGFFGGIRLPLLLAFVAGLVVMRGPVRFAAISAAFVFLAYLPYAHWAPWTVYYLELAPALAAVSAVGLCAIVDRVTGVARAGQAVAVATVAVLAAGVPEVVKWRRDHRAQSALDRQFLDDLQKLPRPAIVFVRYSARVAAHVGVVRNHADLESAPVWVVHDMGPRNEALRRLAPGRRSFDFEEDQLMRQRPR